MHGGLAGFPGQGEARVGDGGEVVFGFEHAGGGEAGAGGAEGDVDAGGEGVQGDGGDGGAAVGGLEDHVRFGQLALGVVERGGRVAVEQSQMPPEPIGPFDLQRPRGDGGVMGLDGIHG